MCWSWAVLTFKFLKLPNSERLQTFLAEYLNNKGNVIAGTLQKPRFLEHYKPFPIEEVDLLTGNVSVLADLVLKMDVWMFSALAAVSSEPPH